MRALHPCVTDPVESIPSPRVLGENDTWLVYFSFFLSCESSIKAKRGGRPYILTGMKPLKTFYILLWVE